MRSRDNLFRAQCFNRSRMPFVWMRTPAQDDLRQEQVATSGPNGRQSRQALGVQMRKLTATSVLLLLLTLVSTPIVFALLPATPESRLPACCRKGGKHHCMGQMPASPGTSIHAIPQCCPLFPGYLAPGVTEAKLFVPPARQRLFAEIVSHPAIATQTEARYRIASERSRLKRGPPARL